MTAAPFEQRNPYKGTPPRPWLRLRFETANGISQEFDLLADTGNPFAVILSQSGWNQLKIGDAPDVATNFGTLQGGWLNLTMPEFGLVQPLICYASDGVAAAARSSHSDFNGLVGLPFLQLLEYGGNADWFWLRK